LAKHPPTGLKRRTREHVIADLSANHVERHALQCGYSVEAVRHDYGIDLFVFTYDRDGAIEPGLLLLQLKATDKLRRVAKRTSIAVRLERRDLVGWLRQLQPVILVVYDARREVAYWLHVQDHFRDGPRVPRDRLDGTRTVRIPTANVMTPVAMREFARRKEELHLRLAEEDVNDVE
jgi:hypothetical protein